MKRRRPNKDQRPAMKRIEGMIAELDKHGSADEALRHAMIREAAVRLGRHIARTGDDMVAGIVGQTCRKCGSKLNQHGGCPNHECYEMWAGSDW